MVFPWHYPRIWLFFYLFKVCDDRLSELIPCLDRNLIYQTRLKLDLAVMEHYERHCPIPERRYNCLIPPPPGYKVTFHSQGIAYIRWNYEKFSVLKYSLLKLLVSHVDIDNRFQSTGPKAETRCGRQIYLIPILQQKNLTRIGWLWKVKK